MDLPYLFVDLEILIGPAIYVRGFRFFPTNVVSVLIPSVQIPCLRCLFPLSISSSSSRECNAMQVVCSAGGTLVELVERHVITEVCIVVNGLMKRSNMRSVRQVASSQIFIYFIFIILEFARDTKVRLSLLSFFLRSDGECVSS